MPYVPFHLHNARNLNTQASNGIDKREGGHNCSSERKNAIKAFIQRYEKVRFTVKYDQDFEEHLEEFIYMCNNYDVLEVNRIYFLKFSLRHGARKYYKRVINDRSRFAEIFKIFRDRYAADTKKANL